MIRLYSFIFFLLFGLFYPVYSFAGFLEMPQITEVPELERRSLLKDLDIPSVRDRDLNPESGPRLNITKFKLQGIVEYPEYGITRADIEKLIEGIRYDLMQEFDLLDSGFTETELEEVSRLLVEIEEETTDRHVTDVELQKLVWLIRNQRSKRGVTLGQIETVADRISQFYRERGFILAKAYIPQQEVRDGIVVLTLLLGTLGEVEAHKNVSYGSDYLLSVFDDMLKMPVTSAAVEENLYLINDFPGIAVSGFFEPGSQVGDTKLNVNVNAENAYDANIRLDNHGSEQTGEYRLYGEVLWNNPFGNADQFHLAALYAANPENTVFGQLRYSTRLFSPRFSLSGGFANNDFVLGPGNSESINKLELFGTTRQADIMASYRFKRSRSASYYGDLKFERIESQLRIGALSDGGDTDAGLDDVVRNISMIFSYDVLDGKNKILHQGDVKLISGRFDKGAEISQDEQYNILDVNYSLLTFWQLPYFGSNTRLIYRASLQYASSPLSSINQYSLAGPTKTRAYPINQFSADNAFYTGVDWIFDAPDWFDLTVGAGNLREIIHPFVFLDASWGEALTLVEGQEDTTAQLFDAGFGLQFAYQDNIHGNLQLAFPLKEKFSSSDIDVPDDSVKFVFDIQYSFR